MERLNKYYNDLKQVTPSSTTTAKLSNPTFPYRTFFTENSVDEQFRYEAPIQGLLFSCRLLRNDDPICVKFVHGSYFEAAHKFCGDRSSAPKLRKVEPLPGGFKMVVMEKLGGDYISLYDYLFPVDEASGIPGAHVVVNQNDQETLRISVKEELAALHDKGFVHGDVRSTNIMIKRSGPFDGHFKFVDFDWSGRIGKAKYPDGVNIVTVSRPAGVWPHGIITKEHNIGMLKYLFIGP